MNTKTAVTKTDLIDYGPMIRKDRARQRWRAERIALVHRQQLDRVARFLAHVTERDPDGEELTRDLENVFTQYLHLNDQTAWPENVFLQRLGALADSVDTPYSRHRRKARFTYSHKDNTGESEDATNRSTGRALIVGLSFRDGCQPPMRRTFDDDGEPINDPHNPDLLIDTEADLDSVYRIEMHEFNLRHARAHILNELTVEGSGISGRVLKFRLWDTPVKRLWQLALNELIEERLVARVKDEADDYYRAVVS
ncbi:MAG: hypothetical protein E6R06_06590 [Mycobacterium sp.]|nr:MAG: hypothetical protein E6R06_06590 [Mycobacterium sp.]